RFDRASSSSPYAGFDGVGLQRATVAASAGVDATPDTTTAAASAAKPLPHGKPLRPTGVIIARRRPRANPVCQRGRGREGGGGACPAPGRADGLRCLDRARGRRARRSTGLRGHADRDRSGGLAGAGSFCPVARTDRGRRRRRGDPAAVVDAVKGRGYGPTV